MDYNILSATMAIVMVLFIIKSFRYDKSLEKIKKLIGVPIEKLEDGVVYHQFPMPDHFILLFEGRKKPKVYTLQGVDLKKLPDIFMFLEEGKRIVPWDPVYLYDTEGQPLDLPKISGFSEAPDEKSLSDEEIIDLKDLAGRQTA